MYIKNETPTPEQQKQIMEQAEAFDASIDPTLKDIAHWLGGWDELRKRIEELEERQWEEYGDRQYEGDGNFADNH